MMLVHLRCPDDSIVVTGHTDDNTNFPTLNALSNMITGGTDGIVAKFDLSSKLPPPPALLLTTIVSGQGAVNVNPVKTSYNAGDQ